MKFILFGQELQGYNDLKPDGVFHDYSELEEVVSGEFHS
jgi:hypothetical protein